MPPSEAPDPSPPEPPKSVLQELADRTAGLTRVHLRDLDSEHGSPSPIVEPKGRREELSPKGRGNYQILGEIARGGMGLVLRGHDSDLGRDVAFKVLDPALAERPEVVQRFVEEAQIGGQLQHPGIVPVYELGLMADERPYFTMKLVKGRTLSELLARRKDLAEGRARFLAIFEAVCQTVAYGHSKSVLHRDLKPANVMVGAFGEVQVVDWGLAKVMRRGGVEDERRAQRAEVTVIETVRSGPGSSGSDSMIGSVLGTPAYMPPEQALGELEKLDERSDVFALGAILCEVLTGKPPYVAAENENIVTLAARARLDDARARIADCAADEQLKELCLECLSPSMAARPHNADEVAVRVQLYLTSMEERTQEAQLDAREARIKAAEQVRRTRLTLALAASVLLSVVGLGGGWLWVQGERERQLAGVREGLEEARVQTLALQEQARWEQAVEAARGGLALVEAGGDTDGGLLTSARDLVAQAEARLAEAAERRAQAERNRLLLERCEELRFQRVALTFADPTEADPRGAIDTQYAAAFRDYGFDLENEDLEGARRILREGGIAVEAALALDEWAALRREMHGWSSFEVESLVALGLEVDPEPTRTALREALFTQDKAAVLAFAGRPDVPTMPAATIWTLAGALRSLGQADAARRVLARAATAQPDDFLINFAFGNLLYEEDELDASTALEKLAVARSQRPGNPYLNAMVGDCHFRLDNHPAAVDAYRDALDLLPDHVGMNRQHCVALLILGRFAEAEVELERMVRDFPSDSRFETYLRIAQVHLGRLSSDELVAWAEENRRFLYPGELRWIAGTLCSLADRESRRLEAALALLERSLDLEPFNRFGLLGTGQVLLQLRRPEEAAELLERARNRGNADLSADVELSAAFAVLHHQLGDAERSRRSLQRAEWLAERLPYDPEGRWESSYVMRWLAEARELVRE